MNVNLDCEKINELASSFAQTGDQLIFSRLFTEIYPFIKAKSESARTKANRLGVYIPLEDFESRFAEGLYEAAREFQPELGKFIPRLQIFMQRKEADTWRQYACKGGEQDENRRSYVKARLESLDRSLISSDNSEYTLKESLLGLNRSAEEEFFEQSDVLYLIHCFENVNQRYAQIIKLLGEGANHEEIAHLLGETEYNPRIRKLVQRAKNSFKRFWDHNH